MRTVELTQGYVTLVDDADFDRVSAHKWCANVDRRRGKVYAYRKTHGPHHKRTSLYLHRELLGVTNPKVRVDHDDGNGLNNQRYNIRVCSTRQNNMNQKKRSDGMSSKYKGVSWHKRDKKFYAAIKIEGKSKFLGAFESERDAAKSYDAAAREHFGDFAVCNFPPAFPSFCLR
jgi:AP2 domain